MQSLFVPIAAQLGAFGLVAMVAARLPAWRRSSFGALRVGLVLALGAAVSVSTPVPAGPGMVFDSRWAFVLLGGAYAGPVGALLATAAALAVRLAMGAVLTPVLASVMLLTTLIASLAGPRLWRGERPPTVLGLALLATAGCVLGALNLFLFLPWPAALEAATRMTAPLTLATVAGTTLLGGLLSAEHRRELEHRERALLVEELSRENRLNRSLVELAPAAVLVQALDGRPVVWNERWLRLWGVDAAVVGGLGGDALGALMASRVADPAAYRDGLARLAADPLATERATLVELADGRALERHSSPLLDSAGRPWARVWHFLDVTGRVHEARALQLLAAEDVLTGCLNRRALFERGAAAVAEAAAWGESLAVIAFDIDHFKAVNDRHGHAAGDRVLREVGQRCREALRPTDLIGRIGGEEFVVVLRCTGLPTAIEIAERLRRALAESPIDGDGGPAIGVSASFGVAVLEPGEGLDQVLERADHALYRAKQDGRDRVRAAIETAAAA